VTVAEPVPSATRQSVLLDAIHLDAAQGMAPYPSGSQIVRVAAAVIHRRDPPLEAMAAQKAMLYIDSAPPKSVDRTYIYETVTILRSEGSVNLEAAATS